MTITFLARSARIIGIPASGDEGSSTAAVLTVSVLSVASVVSVMVMIHLVGYVVG